MQQRMDELVDRFQVQLGEIRKDQKKDIDMLRDRYDDVISKYDADRARVRTQIKDRIEKVAIRLQNMDKRFTNMTIRQETCLDDVDGITVLKTPTRIISDNITSSSYTTTERLEDNSLLFISALTNFFYNEQSSNLFFTREFDLRTL